MCPNDGGGRAKEISDWFDQVSHWLLEMHYDFDYGDESLMARHAKVANGRFCVGDCAYDLVIVPPGVTLRSSTLSLLGEWMDAGGEVVAVKPTPRLVNGRADEDAWDVLKDAVVVEREYDDFAGAVEALVEPSVQILSPEGNPVRSVWYHLREDGEEDILFLANTDLYNGYHCHVMFPGDGALESWNPVNGEVIPVPVDVVDGRLAFEVYMEPAGSFLFVHDASRQPSELPPSAMLEHDHDDHGDHEHDELVLDGVWELERRDPNAITLDTARLCVGTSEPSEPRRFGSRWTRSARKAGSSRWNLR